MTVTSSLAARRSRGPHISMFVRMLVRAAVLRRGRALSSLLAVGVAATVATAMLNLYEDAQAKLQREFRNYGANIVIVGKEGSSLPDDALSQTDAVLAGRGVAAPFSLIVARTGGGQSIVVAGTDFERVKQLDRWWLVNNWPSASQQALIGTKAAKVVTPRNQPFALSYQGKVLQFSPAGTVQTGASEDSRIYVSLADLSKWTGAHTSSIEVEASGSPAQISNVLRELSQRMPSANVRPIRQIMEGEARVLGKTRATVFAASALIILTAALCVFSTLMGWVFDRRRDFAIMKALGASGRLLGAFFAAEAAALGATGAVLGFLAGIGIAAWIGRANFHAATVPRLSVLPVVLAGSMAVTLLAAIVPISLLRRVEPAAILRGE